MHFSGSCVLTLVVALLALSGTGAHGASTGDVESRPVELPGGSYNISGGALFQAGEVELMLEDFPSGPVKLDGVRWHLPPGRAMVLGGAGAQGRPSEVAGLQVGRKADALHFLHTYHPGPALEHWKLKLALSKRKAVLPPEPPTVFGYVVRYADGEALQVPVRWREGVDAWLRMGDRAPMPWAKVAWSKDVREASQAAAVLYHMHWPNPRPDVEIESVDIVSGNDSVTDYGSPAVFAISTGRSDRPGDTYYVAMDGDDSAPGTFEKPWRTVHKAARTLKAGDTVYIRGGDYTIPEAVIVRNSGREGAWITFCGYPGETPRLDGISALMRGQHGLFQVEEKSHIRIKNIQVRNSRNQGINVGKSDHVDILFCESFMTRECGIGAWSACENVRMIGNRVIRPGRPEMSLDEHGRLTPTRKSGHEGLDIGRVFGFEVGWNDIIGSYKEGIDAKGPNRNGRIHHNYIAYSYGNGIYIDSWSDRMHHLEIDHNTLYQTDGIDIGSEDGTPVDHIDVHHNVVLDSWGSGISVRQQHDGGKTLTSDIRVFNNTIHKTGGKYGRGGGVVVNARNGADLRDVAVFGNIVTAAHGPAYAAEGVDMEAQNVSFDYNLREPGADGLKGPHGVTGRVAYRSPKTGDFRPRPGSIALRTANPRNDTSYLGACAPDAVCEPGTTPGGLVLGFYRGETPAAPVTIPQDRFNAVVHQLTTHSWFLPPPAVKHEYSMFHVPEGRQVLGGIEWHVEPHADHLEQPSVCMLGGYRSGVEARRIEGIPVGRKARALHFLHTYHPAPELRKRFGDMGWPREGGENPEKPVVMEYIVHYSDGTETKVPIRYRAEIGPWKAWEQARPITNGRVAWKLHVGGDALTDQQPARRFLMLWRPEGRWVRAPGDLVLYSTRWENPHPDKQITTIDLVSGNTEDRDWGAGALFAISTAEEAD